MSLPAIIDAGDSVKIIYKIKFLLLCKSGVAITSGAVGDVIKVRDEKDKNNIMNCRVIGKALVEIL